MDPDFMYSMYVSNVRLNFYCLGVGTRVLLRRRWRYVHLILDFCL